jgi:hypothetical protein
MANVRNSQGLSEKEKKIKQEIARIYSRYFEYTNANDNPELLKALNALFKTIQAVNLDHSPDYRMSFLEDSECARLGEFFEERSSHPFIFLRATLENAQTIAAIEAVKSSWILGDPKKAIEFDLKCAIAWFSRAKKNDQKERAVNTLARVDNQFDMLALSVFFNRLKTLVAFKSMRLLTSSEEMLLTEFHISIREILNRYTPEMLLLEDKAMQYFHIATAYRDEFLTEPKIVRDKSVRLASKRRRSQSVTSEVSCLTPDDLHNKRQRLSQTVAAIPAVASASSASIELPPFFSNNGYVSMTFFRGGIAGPNPQSSGLLPVNYPCRSLTSGGGDA